MPEQSIQLELARKFDFLKDKITIQRARRMYVHVPAEKLSEVLDFVIKNMKFSVLSAITGLDEGPALGLIYHLGRENGVMLNVSTNVPKEKPVLKTVTPYFPAADVYEREVIDLLGFQIEGLPPGSRYPLTDDWPAGQYPLRKDWKTEDLNKEVTENA